LGLEAQTTAKKVRLNPIYDMRGGAGGTVDVFGRFESQIQQRSDFFLSGLAAEPTDQPDMSDQKSGTPLLKVRVRGPETYGKTRNKPGWTKSGFIVGVRETLQAR
jgi:hypothetical protein